MRTLLTILVFLFGWNANAIAGPDLKRDMAQLDRAFIPVWYHVWTGDVISAKKSVFYLAFEWQKFENRYHNYAPESDDWQETFRRVGAWLDGAYQAIDGNCLDLAYNQLDHVRYEMLDFRTRLGIDYYLDDLFDFECAMGEVLVVIQDPALETLEWDGFRLLTDKMNKSWEVVLLKEPEANIYQLSEAKRQQLYISLELFKAKLDALDQAIKTSDQCEVLEAIRLLEPTFMQVLTTFGNFDWQSRA